MNECIPGRVVIMEEKRLGIKMLINILRWAFSNDDIVSISWSFDALGRARVEVIFKP
jgi:hypothetical protein